jgi:hypothetical protein
LKTGLQGYMGPRALYGKTPGVTSYSEKCHIRGYTLMNVTPVLPLCDLIKLLKVTRKALGAKHLAKL